MKFTFKTDCSTIEQTVVLRPNSTRLDFVTHVDWHEQRVMMRTAFPVNVQSDYATFDIQYAFVKRPTHDNTSWEEAKFETCGQRYADLSQDDYGVALLNDCKYGYRVKGNVLDLNLLRSPKNPDYNADQGEHTFIYSFFPHVGNHLEGCVPDEAAVLNRDPYLAEGYTNDKAEPPCTVESDSVNMEVVKKAEKDDSTIPRLVETAGRHATAVLKLSNPKAKVSVTNLIEWEKGPSLPVENGCVNLSLKPFEILTLRLA
jgi:alpha-mannosidase